MFKELSQLIRDYAKTNQPIQRSDIIMTSQTLWMIKNSFRLYQTQKL